MVARPEIPALDELVQTIASGRALLFTGAGFSSEARDTSGRLLPDSAQMPEELRPMCFGDS
jgi:hypothetical protein